MQLKTNDIYQVEPANYIHQEGIYALTQLYQPMIGQYALSLYLTLYSESKFKEKKMSFQRLLTLLNTDIKTLTDAIYKLEALFLLQTFVKEEKEKNAYLFRLRQPLSTHHFLNSRELLEEYIRVVGEKQAQIIGERYQSTLLSTTGYKEIKVPSIQLTPKIQQQDLIKVPSVVIEHNFQNQTIQFDYAKFSSLLTPILFPISLRTSENLKLIGQVATNYGLGMNHILLLLNDVIDIDTMTFDKEKLIKLAKKYAPEQKTVSDVYELSPVSFLQSKQQGTRVSDQAKEIIDRLSFDYQFPPVVINVLLEYALEQSDQKLSRNFVFAIADTWARKKIHTKQMALEQVQQKKIGSKQLFETKVPEHLEKESVQTTPIQQETLQQFEEMLKKLKGETNEEN